MPVTERHEDVVEILRESFGDDLRVVLVAYLEDDGVRHEKVFFPERIARDYTEGSLDEIAREMLYQGMETTYHESLYELGGLRYTTQRFENAVVMVFPHPQTDRRSTVASVEEDAVGDSVYEAADACADVLGV
ncbi:MAG: hypothetical protein ACLFSW_04690 [Halobacteriales archaeon]